MNAIRLVAIVVFASTWGLQMYLSYSGPSTPSLATGAIYPVEIHGGIVYATHWQRYLASQSAFDVAIALVALNLLLRRLFNSEQSF